MSGCGRKHRAKHLTSRYLDASAWVGPKDGESLAICLESPHGQHLRVLMLQLRTTTGQEGESSTSTTPYDMTEQLVLLPGKFHKVIWLSIKDVVVVLDGAVHFKPSPEQIGNFTKDPAHAGWKAAIEAAQTVAETNRRAVERAPIHPSHGATTTSVLAAQQAEAEAEEQEKKNREHGTASNSDDEVEEELVNPNRNNIKHRQQFFFQTDDVEEEEEEDEEEV